ncbi:MAG: hypothetical protein H3C64_01540 [Candidatus Kuenenia stuttgartiensis]|jgi:hypothetical protein|uniref:DUF7718 domain-containing protein n=1 Tax=Kuenenia stuttgartiensis TaxID=174633 RepID=A0A2C9CGQ2_KUEST|nr:MULTISPECIES: hypothetical protein [Kuenenia]MBE7545931.1 hypothetical protein [Planctomycetia bacterium]MCZ7562441.1 hypothetical protein [Burkholderiales bacterium]MBW7941090.1 hypothetical protein [Candidatus Kuenenia stuttgartiensis]MBZ0193010.1 hypothetical protein [Candidatus Kuenenia stuttgartiensis]MCL4727100.1 hypothetical protein [Candidatus Kuenenia stuttgartiensis]
MDKEYFLELEEKTIVYVHFKTEKGYVTEFVVKLLSAFEGEWHEILRYDSGHGCPHKDILNTDGKVTRKIWYDFLDNGQALTMAIKDIKDNFEFYKERYQKWLKEY